VKGWARWCPCGRHRIARVIAKYRAGRFDAAAALDRIRRIAGAPPRWEGTRNGE
jgi:hypothetical protein